MLEGPCFHYRDFGVIGRLEGVIVIDDVSDYISGYASTKCKTIYLRGRYLYNR